MTVDEKRKLELKTMYQIIGIYCHNKHHTPKGQLCEECQKVWQYAEHRIDVCPHMESKTSAACVKRIAMRLRIVKKYVKSCAMVDLECYLYHPFKLFVICI